MTARVFYASENDAGAAAEVLRSFGLRAAVTCTTVAQVCHGTEHVEWEVIALDLPAQQSATTPAVGPITDVYEDDKVSSYWWDDYGHGRNWERDW